MTVRLTSRLRLVRGREEHPLTGEASHGAATRPRRAPAAIVRRLLRAGLVRGRVLDVGAGAGDLLRELEVMGFQAVGAESMPEAIDVARSRTDCELQLADVCQRLPWSDASFDAVVLHDVIERLDDDRAAIGEIRRVLRPGGFVLVSSMNAKGLLARLLGRRWAFHQDASRRRAYDLPALVGLLGYAGFDVVDWGTFFDLEKARSEEHARCGLVVPGAGLGDTVVVVGRTQAIAGAA